ncbi:MAG: helix-turn-helix domain-containing protein [Syntrophobacteraceae bacterium]|jgi:transcriptional regulator with XRE-family HTH domain|nr:helix-turn-helix domain-containing protein [Syntrophobacteraceae bacterium]
MINVSSSVRVTSGVQQLDQIFGGLFIGDNVIWHDDSGSLATPFCHQFLQASQAQGKPIVYVCFDRSPRNLLDKLGKLAQNESLTILDCFTSGKGANAPTFLRFYDERSKDEPYRIIRVEEPRKMDQFSDILYGVHGKLQGDVRLVFESITGMQEIWGGEEHILNFYSHACPRLYELNTIAYWIMEKKAHSPRLRAQISQIAQVVIELMIKRGTTSITLLKAEKRDLDNLHQPFSYRIKGQGITFDDEKGAKGGTEFGVRLRELRTRRGISQTELARLVGVTPSTISQVESNLIYPSLPALLKMAEVLGVEVNSFFQEKSSGAQKVVFSGSDATEIKFSELPAGCLYGKSLYPVDAELKAEPVLLEVPPHTSIPSHFFFHKGEEMGYVISGSLTMRLKGTDYTVHEGDVAYLKTQMPSQWTNAGDEAARILWVRIH